MMNEINEMNLPGTIEVFSPIIAPTLEDRANVLDPSSYLCVHATATGSSGELRRESLENEAI